jgi:hypothetical protein
MQQKKGKNLKAFGYNSNRRAAAYKQRNLDREFHREHVPLSNRQVSRYGVSTCLCGWSE